MNERINELNREAQAFAIRIWGDDEDYFNQWVETYKEKLAELIVRESVGIADDYVKDCTCDEHKNCKHPRIAIGRKIGEHFGVKE